MTSDRETLRRLIVGDGETRIDSYEAAERVLAAGWRQFAPISEAPTDGTTVVVWAAPAHGLPGTLTWCAYHPDAGWCVCELREVTHYLPGLTLDGLVRNSEGVSRGLLSEGLDLCVRARNMDARERTAAQIEASADPDWWTPETIAARAERHNAVWPDQPMSTSATLPLWVQDQYDRDLADWERRTRAHLTAPEGRR